MYRLNVNVEDSVLHNEELVEVQVMLTTVNNRQSFSLFNGRKYVELSSRRGFPLHLQTLNSCFLSSFKLQQNKPRSCKRT